MSAVIGHTTILHPVSSAPKLWNVNDLPPPGGISPKTAFAEEDLSIISYCPVLKSDIPNVFSMNLWALFRLDDILY